MAWGCSGYRTCPQNTRGLRDLWILCNLQRYFFLWKVNIISPSNDICVENTHCHAAYGFLSSVQSKPLQRSFLCQSYSWKTTTKELCSILCFMVVSNIPLGSASRAKSSWFLATSLAIILLNSTPFKDGSQDSYDSLYLDDVKWRRNF